MAMTMLLVSPQVSFAASGLQGFVESYSAGEWVMILLGAGIFILFLLFLVLALILYTVLVTVQRKRELSTVVTA
ncbi:hypothetical protein V6R21_30940 [Limibacter armeniacum]|uniref:hypothetical protein n=1 Tax=Limibacter armeniacum TaxID=466084 RepID=UPI002FE63CB4